MIQTKYQSKHVVNTTFYCRGYFCYHSRKQGCYSVSYRPRKANYWLPRRFKFFGPKEDLEDYIEALVFRSAKSADFENAGNVRDMFFIDPPAVGEEAENYYISPGRLWQVMLGNDPLAIPETCGISFVRTKEGPIIPREIMSYLVSQDLWKDLEKDKAHYEELAEQYGCTFRWKAVRKSVHAELVPLDQVLPDGTVLEDDDLQKVSQTTLLQRELPNGAQETIVQVFQGGQSYYGREITLEGNIVYRGTSNSAAGPWETVQACLSTCAVLGLDIEAEEPA